ncbi:hypothetical protein ABZ456_07215 [Streptomyces sp. NPDC005776]|uniref:hypothetical protein n=1 Tax=Streptomyces sp. NPDC005776 TaxID=3154676 RepID=UPI003405F96F
MKTSALGRIALVCGVAALAGGVVPGAAHADDATVEKKILPVMVEFSDSTFQHVDAVKASTPDTYFGTKADSVASFFKEMSRGRFAYVPAVKEQTAGPITLSLSAAGCDHGKINTLTQEALAKQGLVRGEDYDSLSMVFPAQKTGCPWAGLATVPGPYSWINLYGTAGGLGVVGHELGHNQGLGHQGREMCTDGDLVDCEADGTSAKSIMGGGGPAAGFSAPELIRAGWLSGGEAVKVAESGTYTLRSLHGEGGGTRALDIPMGEDRLVIEYRHAAGTVDARIEGVHAYRVPKGAYGSSSLIDLTEENETAGNSAPSDADAVTTLTDTASRVSVAVLASGGGKATVKVALNGESLAAGVSDDTPEKAVNPEHTASDTDAGDGASAAPAASADSGTEAQGETASGAEGRSGDAVRATAGNDSADLAATGAGPGTLPLVAAGAALVVVGGAIVLGRRRKRA